MGVFDMLVFRGLGDACAATRAIGGAFGRCGSTDVAVVAPFVSVSSICEVAYDRQHYLRGYQAGAAIRATLHAVSSLRQAAG
jgi:hypothetical protein